MALVAGVPLAVAALSYAGGLIVSVQMDSSVPDLDILAAGLAEELDMLTEQTQTIQEVIGHGTHRR